jgi:hypothetical protein
MPDAPALARLSYAQVRLRWCRVAIVALLKRWSVYTVLTVVMLGAFSAGALTSMSAMVAWAVLPVFRAVGWPLWLATLCVLGHALVGVLILRALHPVLWPATWRDALHALPISERERLLSDVQVLTLALLPLFGLYLAGALTWSLPPPPWLHGQLWRAWLQLLLSMALSLVLGLATSPKGLPAWVRRAGRAALSGTMAKAKGQANSPAPTSAKPRAKLVEVHTGPHSRYPIWHALIARPLWRGPARRVGHMLVLSLLALLTCDVALARATPSWAPWWLAGFGLLAMASGSRLHSLIQSDLQPLHAACAPLPIPPQKLSRWRLALALTPCAFGLAGLLMTWAQAPAMLRPGLALMYASALVSSQLWLHTQDTADAQVQVTRWMLTLIALTAVASEVYV